MNKKKIMNLEKVTSWIQYGVNLMKYTDTALGGGGGGGRGGEAFNN